MYIVNVSAVPSPSCLFPQQVLILFSRFLFMCDSPSKVRVPCLMLGRRLLTEEKEIYL